MLLDVSISYWKHGFNKFLNVASIFLHQIQTYISMGFQGFKILSSNGDCEQIMQYKMKNALHWNKLYAMHCAVSVCLLWKIRSYMHLSDQICPSYVTGLGCLEICETIYWVIKFLRAKTNRWICYTCAVYLHSEQSRIAFFQVRKSVDWLVTRVWFTCMQKKIDMPYLICIVVGN